MLHIEMMYDIASPHTIRWANATSVKEFLGVFGVDMPLQFDPS